MKVMISVLLCTLALITNDHVIFALSGGGAVKSTNSGDRTINLQSNQPSSENFPKLIRRNWTSEDLLVAENSSFKLKCGRFAGASPYELIWIKNDDDKIRKLKTLPNLNDTSNELILTVEHAKPADSGIYRCLVQNAFGAMISAQINVTVAYINSFLNSIDNRITASRNVHVILTPPVLIGQPLELITWLWTFENQPIFSNFTHFVSNDGRLLILNVQDSNVGRYTLTAHHEFLDKRSDSVDFLISLDGDTLLSTNFDSPQIVIPPKDTKFRAHSWTNSDLKKSDLVLECVAYFSNSENVQITWFLNQTVVLKADNVKYAMERYNRRLTIINPTAEHDNGIYTCQAALKDSPFVHTQKQASIEITEIPHKIKSDSDGGDIIVSTLGSSDKLTCEISSGNTKHEIRWFFNGVNINHYTDLCCNQTNSPLYLTADGSITFRSLEDRNVGVYQCEAENEAGSVMMSFYLLEKPLKQQRVISKIYNISANIGEPVELSCTGARQSRVKWFFEDNEIRLEDGNYQISKDGTGLIIAPNSFSQRGSYSCVSETNPQNVYSKTFLNILGKIQISNGPTDQSVIIGSNVMFPCEVSSEFGDQHFARQWYFKNQLITTGTARNIEVLPDGRLLIKQVGPNNIGIYACTITSSSGTQQQSGLLRIIEKPNMPLYVKAHLINNTLPAKVEITWVDGFDGNSPIIKYAVELRTLGAQNLWSDWEMAVENVAKEQRDVLIDNLKPSSTYQFRVIAFNRFGPGTPSQPSNDILMPQQPPAASPRNVAGSARSSSTIMVQWQPPPPDQWNGDILGYMLRYRLANYPDIPWIMRNVSDSRTRNVLLEDLITWREYEIQVAAYNERGMGVFSKALYITTMEGVPVDSPFDVNVTVLNSTSIYVSFSPPPQQMVPGVNLGYKAEFWRKTAIGTGKPDKLVKILPYSLTKIERNVSGLEKYTSYNVTVLCYTAQGDGPRSRAVQLTTKQDLPDKIKNFIADEVLFDSVKLVWEVPLNPNGILTNYSLTYWIANETAETKRTVNLSPNSSWYKVQGLTASTKYFFELFASTEVGSGPPNIIHVTSGVPPELPGPPTTLVLSNIQARSVAVQFTPGFDGKTIISRWIVEALIGQSTNWTEIFNVSAPDAKIITVLGLHPFTDYRLRIISENVKGTSSPSEPSDQFQTLQAPPEYAPLDIDAQPISSNALKVTWTPLQLDAWNGIAKGYEIHYRPSSLFNAASNLSFNTGNAYANETSKIIINDIMTSEYELSNLRPFSSYISYMYAVGEIGSSERSPVIEAKTYEGVPTSSPRNLKTKSISARSIKLAWDPISPEYSNGVIIGCKAIAKPSNLQSETISVTTGSSESNAELTPLFPHTEFSIRLYCFTVAGDSPFEELTIQTKEDLPGPPSEIVFPYVTVSEIRITWKPPVYSNGAIIHYSVSYWPNNTDSEQTSIKTTLNSDLRMFVATGIIKETLYGFTVAAETSVGWGPEAQAYVFTSVSKQFPTPPGRPQQNLSQPQGSRFITIQFDHDQNFMIRYFKVEYLEVNTDQWKTWIDKIPPTSKWCTVYRLKPNTAYSFRVKTVNDYGESANSPESDWIKTLEAEPSAPPTSIRASAYNATAAKLTFDAPPLETWNSDFIGYRIVYKIYGGGGSSTTSIAASSSNNSETAHTVEVPTAGTDRRSVELNIGHLKQFNHYVVQAQTTNQQGTSPFSSGTFVYVGYALPVAAVRNAVALPISSTQIRLMWDSWSLDSELINGFKIDYKATLSSDPPRQDVVPASLSTFDLHNLLKFTNYSIEICVFNRAGRGPAQVLHAQTFPDKPGPVGSLTFSDIQLDSVNVSWTAPQEPNGVILGYIVIYKTYKMEDVYIKQIQEKTTRSYLPVNNLEENVTSIFTVQAETVTGYGVPLSAKVTVGPQLGSPAAPSRPMVYPTETNVRLEWEKNSDGQSPVTSYIIQNYVESRRSLLHSITRREAIVSSNAMTTPQWSTLTLIENAHTSYTISYSQLEPSAIHRFRVVARNRQGVSYPSPESDPVVVPESVDDAPFYLQWWFLVILALISLVIIVIVVAILYVTGRDRKFEYKRKDSINSLNLIDGGVVTYELRSSQKSKSKKSVGGNGSNSSSRSVGRKNPYIRHPPFNLSATYPDKDLADFVGAPSEETVPVPVSAVSVTGRNCNPHKSASQEFNVGGGPTIGGKSVMPSFYETLNSGENACISMDPGVNDCEDVKGLDDEHDFESTEQDVSSMVQHYQNSNLSYRETWRQAVKTAAQRLDSFSSLSDKSSCVHLDPMNVNDNNGTNGPYRHHHHQTPGVSRAPVPGFSSFV